MTRDDYILQLMTCVKDNRLRVRVKPNARKTAISKIEDGVVHLDVAAPPEDGKANDEIERFLSKTTGKRATIKSGFTGKEKTVLLS